MAAPPSGAGTARPRLAEGWRRSDGIALAVLAALTYVPLLFANRGRLNADTKQYLYLDPGGLLQSAPHLWNRRVSGGTITHQNLGYLWPMGPYYRLTDLLGVPDWVAQRFWMGSIMFAAAAGAFWLFRSLWRDRRAAMVGALVYGLSPFVLGHITGQSALLLPFSALPWLVIAVRNALRADPWRWAAVFALVTTSAGSLNGSSIFFVLFGACLWIPYAVWWERSATLRHGVLVLVRLGALTLVTQLWWLMAYSVGGKYGLPILQVTETVRETSATTSAVEIFRGLGYWFFYGGDNQGPWLHGVAPPFTQSLTLLALSFVAPLACLALGWWSRFRERAFFVGLVLSGLVISTVAFGTTDRSLVGTIFESMSRHSGLVLSLRNTQRAAALTALGLAGLAAAGVTALRERDLRLGRAATALVVGGVLLTFSSPWSSALVADRYDRKEDVPQAWIDTAAYLDRVGGRAMVVPGEDFASYRWGHTLDPVLAGLTRTELVWRELLPMGGEAGADLVGAFDQGLQEGWFDPRTIVPVARALGVTHIVVANDDELERYRLPRPEVVMKAFLDPSSGLTLERSFGLGYVNANPGTPIVDSRTQQVKTHGDAVPLPEVAVFSVPGVRADPVSATVQGAETVVHGDGAGVLAAAAAGLLDAGHLPLLSGTDLATWPAARRAARHPGARHIVTDTARKQVRRYTSLQENTGATQAADGTPHSGIASDVDASDFTGGTNRSESIVELDGAKSIDASGYGNVISLLPEDRPTNAFDGDPRTSWRYDSARFRPLHSDNTATLTIDLGRAVTADHVDVVQPTNRPGTVPFSRFDVVLDGTRVIPVTADPAAVLDPAGTRVELDGKPFSTLELRIPDTGFTGPVGVAELAIPGVHVEELVRLPETLATRGRSAAPFPLAYVLSRLHLDPSALFRMDPELAMHRQLSVPTAMTFTLSGTAHLNGRAEDATIDALTGTDPAGATFSSSARLLGDAAARASAAADGDPSTAWSTPLGTPTGATWTARLDDGFRLPSLAIDVVTDAQHSVPTRLGITVDGVTHEFAVPGLGVTDGPNSTTRVVYTPDQPLEGHTLGIEVLDVAPRTQADLGGGPVTLPVALAEVGLTARTTANAAVDTGCRSDLLTVDGAAVPVQVTGDPGRDGTGALAVTTCDGAPLALGAGTHVLRTAPGLTTGVDLDRLALVSPEWAAAPSTADLPGGPTVVRADTGSATVVGHGAPYWVRLDQSSNRGWEASATWPGGSADLGPAHTLDAFASGWSMTRGTHARVVFAFSWPPQRTVDLALAVSGLACLVCLALVVFRRRTAVEASPPPRLARDPFSVGRVPILASVAVVAVGAACASPAVGLALVLLAVAASFAARRRALAAAVRVTPLAAVGAAVAFVWLKQARNDYPHVALWPSYFRLAHFLVYFGLLAFGLLVLADRPADLEPEPAPPAEPPGRDQAPERFGSTGTGAPPPPSERVGV